MNIKEVKEQIFSYKGKWAYTLGELCEMGNLQDTLYFELETYLERGVKE